MEVYVVIEEDVIGARASYASSDKEKCETYIKNTFGELRYLTDDAWRAGSTIVSIHKLHMDK